MVYVFTPKCKCRKITDIESRFSMLKYSGELFDDEIYYKIMQQIDGVYSKDGDIIENRFGRTLMDNLSTGCKAVLLAVMYSKSDEVVSVDECGDNALKVVFELGKKMDIKIFVTKYIKVLDNEAECMLSGKRISGGYNIYKRLETLNE